MPTYEYKCNACKKKMEIFQSIKEDPKRKCPECGKNALERLIGTGGAIIFKGSGFYQTDYRSESYKKAAEADKPAESTSSDAKADSKTEAKTDANPQTKAESKPVSEPKAKADKPAKAEKKAKKAKSEA
ncbi:MAG TPA: zinc ribbon domain-containing protein [Phycisphaerales bacterium]|nr:zinc ribbon domain-containing protein [Phycisphaerales bacterium]